MPKTIIAIGGGEMGRIKMLPDGTAVKTPIETMKIDQFLVKSSGKKHPHMIFLGTASNDDPVWFEQVKNHFENLGCARVDSLPLVNTVAHYDEIKSKILSADIIYVGGGDTTTMLKIWAEQGVDKILYQAWQQGIVLAGISAGAICWFEYYDNMDDIDSIEQLDLVKGLSFIKGFAVPHYNTLTEDEKNHINDKLRQRKISGWSLDDCTALVFQDDYVMPISCCSDRYVKKIP